MENHLARALLAGTLLVLVSVVVITTTPKVKARSGVFELRKRNSKVAV